MGSLSVRVGTRSATLTYTVTQPATGLMIGTTEAAYSQLEYALGKPLAVRRSYDGVMPSAFSACKAAADVGKRASWISFTAFPTAAVARSFFASIPAGHRVMVTCVHEADNGKMTGTAFAPQQAALMDALNASGADRSLVTCGPILTANTYRNGGYTAYYPDPAAYDFIGVDAYRFWRPPGSPPDPKTGNLGQQRTLQWLIGAAPTLSAQTGKPVAVGEFGAHPFPDDPANRPAWLTESIGHLRSINATAAVYFHSGQGESGPWWLDRFHFPETAAGSDPDSVRALADLI